MTPAGLLSTGTRRERWAWYLYDFGNSAYAAVVLLAVYSAYFQGEVVGGPRGTSLWGWAVFIAMVVVALTAPVLGAIADFSGSKKRFLFFFTIVSCLFTACLFFATPGQVVIGMGAFIVAEIGYRSAQVFYNGLLPEIAGPDEMGRVSGNGWAIGNVGAIVCLLLILPLIVLIGGTFIVRLSLVITAIFFVLFSLPLFFWLPERAQARPLPPGENYLSISFKRLAHTFRAAGRFREFIKFVVAFLVYNDGVIMALDFAAIIGAVLFDMTQEQLILFVILVHVTNVAGAYVFGQLVDRTGGKRALLLSLLLMVVVIVWLFFNQTQSGYYLIGAVAGFAMAGAQSVSRTMVALFSPHGQSAEFYGFFAFAGRTSSFIGPGVYGWLAAGVAFWLQDQGREALAAEQMGQRVAILSIGLFILVGLILLTFVDERKARDAAAGEIEK
ncbi:MAG: MFS transporter [Anaerolineae bacterium]|jgi:UMF1 family MFS transporter